MEQKITIIANRQSRGGRGGEILRIVENRLQEVGIRYAALTTRGPGDATRLARMVCQDSLKTEEILQLIIIGGDGTINEVVNGITDFSRVHIGVVPTGSGNDFARELGITGTPEEMTNRILKDLAAGKSPDPVDIGRVEYGGKSRYYTISSGVGMDAMACKLADRSKLKKVLNKLHLGSIIYVAETIKALFTMDTTTMTVQYTDVEGEPQEETFRNMIFTAAMNFKCEGGGVPMSPQANPRDGKLSQCIVSDVPKWKTFFLLPKLAMGKHEKMKCFRFFDADTLKVSMDHPMALHTDGEYLGDVTEVTFTAMPGYLQMIGLETKE